MSARVGVSISTALCVLLAATASRAAGEEKPGRYSMSPADGGFVRLDTETGAMAFCKRSSDGAWACEAMPDREAAMRQDLQRLERENEALRRGQTPPPAAQEPAEPAPPGGEGKVPLPSEEDVDKVFDYVEGMVRKLKERLKRLEEKEADKGTPL